MERDGRNLSNDLKPTGGTSYDIVQCHNARECVILSRLKQNDDDGDDRCILMIEQKALDWSWLDLEFLSKLVFSNPLFFRNLHLLIPFY